MGLPTTVDLIVVGRRIVALKHSQSPCGGHVSDADNPLSSRSLASSLHTTFSSQHSPTFVSLQRRSSPYRVLETAFRRSHDSNLAGRTGLNRWLSQRRYNTPSTAHLALHILQSVRSALSMYARPLRRIRISAGRPRLLMSPCCHRLPSGRPTRQR